MALFAWFSSDNLASDPKIWWKLSKITSSWFFIWKTTAQNCISNMYLIAAIEISELILTILEITLSKVAFFIPWTQCDLCADSKVGYIYPDSVSWGLVTSRSAHLIKTLTGIVTSMISIELNTVEFKCKYTKNIDIENVWPHRGMIGIV